MEVTQEVANQSRTPTLGSIHLFGTVDLTLAAKATLSSFPADVGPPLLLTSFLWPIIISDFCLLWIIIVMLFTVVEFPPNVSELDKWLLVGAP